MSGTPLPLTLTSLAAAPHLGAAAARLMEETWPDWYGPGGEGNAAEDIARRSCAESLPCGLAAVTEEGRLAGLVTLDASSHGALAAEGFWMNGLVTDPACRRQGVADALVAALEAEAARRGACEIHSTTVAAGGLLERRGWRKLRQLDDGWAVYALRLK
ncbi:GNAT family N-acetyltransferase [Pseudoroseicyclus sp. CXY001]|uniref:GNAT family N-acetyltransferase n=1 Tax=Pseudoroseicyclus sp. CXY001 TaxID=3242492 RepID=UPI003571245F